MDKDAVNQLAKNLHHVHALFDKKALITNAKLRITQKSFTAM
jgi:hypothetical protein